MRIFDNPNHPHYGPVRRLWVVLVQLDLLDAAEKWSVERGQGWTWDQWLAAYLTQNPGIHESRFQRGLIREFMRGYQL